MFGLSQAGLAVSPKVTDMAKPQTPNLSVFLSKIKAHKISERKADEVYVDVLQFSSNKRPKYFRIPHKPHHWPSMILPKLKDVLLWQDQLKEGEKATFIISLLEKDAPPWDIDDLIGAVKLVVKLEKGKMHYFLGKPDAENIQLKAFNRVQTQNFDFKGGHGEYEIVLKLQSGRF